MPFKSKSQQRFMFAAEERGDLPKGIARQWAEHTPKIKKLPEKAKKTKTAMEIVTEAFDKISAATKKEPKTSAQIAEAVMKKVALLGVTPSGPLGPAAQQARIQPQPQIMGRPGPWKANYEPQAQNVRPGPWKSTSQATPSGPRFTHLGIGDARPIPSGTAFPSTTTPKASKQPSARLKAHWNDQYRKKQLRLKGKATGTESPNIIDQYLRKKQIAGPSLGQPAAEPRPKRIAGPSQQAQPQHNMQIAGGTPFNASKFLAKSQAQAKANYAGKPAPTRPSRPTLMPETTVTAKRPARGGGAWAKNWLEGSKTKAGMGYMDFTRRERPSGLAPALLRQDPSGQMSPTGEGLKAMGSKQMSPPVDRLFRRFNTRG